MDHSGAADSGIFPRAHCRRDTRHVSGMGMWKPRKRCPAARQRGKQSLVGPHRAPPRHRQTRCRVGYVGAWGQRPPCRIQPTTMGRATRRCGWPCCAGEAGGGGTQYGRQGRLSGRSVGSGQKAGGLALLDANIAGPLSAGAAAAVRARGLRVRKIYADHASAVEAFRPFRSTVMPFPDLLRHIGENSITPAEGGWTWKFDPRTFIAATQPPPAVTRLRCPAAIVRAEHGSVLSDSGAHALIDGLGAPRNFMCSPDRGTT